MIQVFAPCIAYSRHQCRRCFLLLYVLTPTFQDMVSGLVYYVLPSCTLGLKILEYRLRYNGHHQPELLWSRFKWCLSNLAWSTNVCYVYAQEVSFSSNSSNVLRVRTGGVTFCSYKSILWFAWDNQNVGHDHIGQFWCLHASWDNQSLEHACCSFPEAYTPQQHQGGNFNSFHCFLL